MAPDATVTTHVGDIDNIEMSNAERLDRKEIRDQAEDERQRREGAKDAMKAEFKNALLGIYETDLLSNLKSSSSHLTQLTSRDEKAYKLACLALSRLVYLRRNLCPTLVMELLKDEGIVDETGNLMADFVGCFMLEKFLAILSHLPTRDLILPPVVKSKDKLEKETAAAKQKTEQLKKDIKDTREVKSDDEKKPDVKDDKEDDTVEEAPELSLFQIVKVDSWAFNTFLGILNMILANDSISRRHTPAGFEVSSEAICIILTEMITVVRKSIIQKLGETGLTSRDDALMARSQYWLLIAHDRLAVSRDVPRTNYNTDDFIDEMLHAFRLCFNNKCFQTQATLLNAVLRVLVVDKQDWTRAASILCANQYPKQVRTNSYCRYLLYSSIIYMMNNQTAEGFSEANKGARRAYDAVPSGPRGRGIRLEIVRLLMVSDLLLGKTPSRTLMNDPELGDRLDVFKNIAKAVHLGQVHEYQRLLTQHEDELKSHYVYPVIKRNLITAVMRASLMRIAQTYRKITLKDVCEKIGMDGHDIEETYSIVTQAISDRILVGVTIEDGCLITSNKDIGKSAQFIATINQRRSYMQTILKELTEALCTVQDDECDDKTRLKLAEKARREAEESAARASDAYFDDFD